MVRASPVPTRPRAGRTPGLAAFLGAAGMLVALGACVTERPTPESRGVPLHPGGATRAPGSGATGVALPAGPIASAPTKGASQTTASRVIVEVAPMGSVAYDGQVLPIVSPDGAHMAVQEGEAPTWDVLLARPGARPSLGTRVAIYRVQFPAGQPPRTTRAEFDDPPEPGLVLGRGADGRGVIVECPREDGSRWIGRLNWTTGAVEWLVRDNATNAHAVLLPNASLAYTRRAPGEATSELVLLHDGRESVRRDPTGSYLFPTCAGDPTVLYAFVWSAQGLDLEAIRIPERAERRLGSSLARRRLLDSGTDATAFQAVAGVQSIGPMERPMDRGLEPAPALAIFHAGFGRCVLFDPGGAGWELLPEASIAAAPWSDGVRSGHFCATPEHMLYAPLASGGPRDARPAPARVLADAGVPRRVFGEHAGLIVFGPVKGDPTRLAVTFVRITP